MYLEENIKGLCDKLAIKFTDFLSDFEVEAVSELSISDLEVICDEYHLDLYALIFNYLYKSKEINEKLKKIKLLILDVDGVLTNGGMYFTDEGKEFKRFNTKDGMAIIHLTKNNFQVAIISSGFKSEIVDKRAKMLGIQHCTVSREPKVKKLEYLLEKLSLDYENVAMIGDDINDIEVMQKIGVSACPKDSVNSVKSIAQIVLEANGGEACVREFIDNYLLEKPL